MASTIEKQHHLNIANPTECWELTIFTETECWEMCHNGIVTYDEADYMASGVSLFQARIFIAESGCPCEMCDI